MHDHEGKEKGAGGPAKAGGSRKTRRAEGPQAASLNDFILRLHTFARDWAQVANDLESAEGTLLAGFLDELAAVLQDEYDIRHG